MAMDWVGVGASGLSKFCAGICAGAALAESRQNARKRSLPILAECTGLSVQGEDEQKLTPAGVARCGLDGPNFWATE